MPSRTPGCTALSHDDPNVITARSPHIYPFLDLPAELRNEIYIYIFGNRVIALYPDNLNTSVTGVTSKIYHRTQNNGINAEDLQPRRPSHTFAMLKTCRQINIEARTLPYELNVFSLSFNYAVERMARTQVLAARIRLIRTVKLGLFKLAPLYIEGGFAVMVQTLAKFVEPQVVEVNVISRYSWGYEPIEVLTESVRKVVRDAMGREVEVRIPISRI